MKRALARWTLILFLSIVPLVALELILRILQFPEIPGNDYDPLARTKPAGSILGYRETVLEPNKAVLANVKRENTTRVFIFGASVTMGYIGGDDSRAPEQRGFVPENYPTRVQRLLKERHPDREFEVLSFAWGGFGTNRIAALVREMSRFKPDIVLVTVGGNEIMEGILERKWRTIRLMRTFRTALLANKASSIIAQWRDRLRSGGGGVSPSNNVFGSWTANSRDAFDVTPAARSEILRNTEQNLRDIAKVCKRTGSTLIFMSDAANLRYISWNHELRDLAPGQKAQFAKGIMNAQEAQKKGAWRDSLLSLQKTLDALPKDTVSSCYAYFLQGKAYDGCGDFSHAKESFIACLNIEPNSVRMQPGIVELMRKISNEEKALFIDNDAAYAAVVPDSIPDGRLFYDHGHPRQCGHDLMAEEVMSAIEEREGIPKKADIQGVASAIREELKNAPPAYVNDTQWPDVEDLLNLGNELLKPEGNAEAALTLFLAALEKKPELDVHTYLVVHQLQRDRGDKEAALATLRQATTRHDSCVQIHANIAQLLLELGDRHSAKAAYKKVRELQPGYRDVMLDPLLAQ